MATWDERYEKAYDKAEDYADAPAAAMARAVLDALGIKSDPPQEMVNAVARAAAAELAEYIATADYDELHT